MHVLTVLYLLLPASPRIAEVQTLTLSGVLCMAGVWPSMSLLTCMHSPSCMLLKTGVLDHFNWVICDPQVWEEHIEVTADLVLSHFVFSLPLDGPPSFATSLVSLRWLLRFELTMSSGGGPAGWLGGTTAKTVERITWALPVLVLPPAMA